MQSLKSILAISLILIGLIACRGNGQPLRANAGQDFTVIVGTAPTFDGCASTGEIVNYRWTIISAPDKMSADTGKVIREAEINCSFTLEAQMGVDEVGEWIIELEVRGPEGNTNTDTVLVNVIS